MKTCTGLLAVALLVSPAGAALITADTIGNDNATAPDYYGLQFVSGEGSVQSVTIDISGTSGAMFDFDGSANYANGTNPVLRLPSLVGLNASDISFSWADPVGHPNQFTINFAPGTFTAGDSFRFGADTDFLVVDPAPGRVFGMANVPISVVLLGGMSGSSTFVQKTSIKSTAEVSVTPEPATVALLLAGLFARRIVWRR